jgi:hypothetical protein
MTPRPLRNQPPTPPVRPLPGQVWLRITRNIERVCPRSLQDSLPFALTVVAAGYAVMFLVCVAARLTFGFELAWLESGMQAMTDRLAAHQSIYAEPSPSYVPFIYPPLYYVIAHDINRLLPGLGRFTPMRLVSLLATLATVLTVFVTLGRRSFLGPRRRLLLSALFLAFYGRFEFWHDTSRVDSLFVCLLFAATALMIEGRGGATALAAGALGGLAILTKQPAVPLLAVAAGAVVVAGGNRGRVAVVLLVAGLTTAAGLMLLGELRNPWLYYYLLRVPATHPILPSTLIFSALFLLVTMPLFVLVAGAELRRRPAGHDTGDDAGHGAGRVWALTFAAWALAIFLLRLKQGASINFFLPLVPVGILVIATQVERLGARSEMLVLVQFLILAYNPLAAIPTAADWRAGFQLLGALDRIPGEVFLPQFPSYLSMLGKAPVAHGVAVCDLMVLRPDLLETIRAQVEDGRYAAALPWAVDGNGHSATAEERCRPRHFARPSHEVEDIPHGGAFFAAGHGSKLGGIYRFDAAGAPRADVPPGQAVVAQPALAAASQ